MLSGALAVSRVKSRLVFAALVLLVTTGLATSAHAQGASCPAPTLGADGIYRGTCIEGNYTVQGPTIITGLTHIGAGATLTIGTTVSEDLPATAAAPPAGGFPKNTVYLETGSMQVDKGGIVTAEGNGFTFVGASYSGPPPTPHCKDYSGIGGYGPGTTQGPNGLAGGSYGGAGGKTTSDNSTDASYEYGTVRQPTDFGSSGWTSALDWTTANGGGAIRLIVDGAMVFNGIMEANGTRNSNLDSTCGPDNYNGGSGGSIWVTTNTLSGAGSFYAAGGWNTSGPYVVTDFAAAPGGGGRIWVEYQDGSGYTGFGTNSSDDGATFAGYPGSTYGASHGSLAFAIPGATNADPYGLVVDKYYTIPANTTITYTSLTVLAGGVLTVGGGSTVNVTGAFKVTGNSTVILQSLNTSAQVNGQWAGQGSVINAGSMQVDAGSSINADAQGYLQEAGPGAAAGPYSTAGGSYGGGAGGLTGDPTVDVMTYEYGLAKHPTDLGSGGWEYGSSGGTGGGLVQIAVTGSTIMNGTISANGSTGQFNSAGGGAGGGGGGSGGGIYVTTGTLAGSGTFSAVGGGVIESGAGGGGGGRIYVSDSAGSTFTGFTKATAAGGAAGTSRPGFPGTIAFVDTSVDTGSNTGSQGALMVYEPYTIPAGTTATYDSITVLNGTTLTIGGGSTLTVNGAVYVTGNSQIVLQSINNTAQVNGTWVGQGSTVTAASVNVDAGSSINADGQGYVQEAGPGAAAGPYSTAGGSYGGAGGNLAAGSVVVPTFEYGSEIRPTDLGSGGWEYGSVGGNGGGAVQLFVSGTTTLNGTITANGAAGGYNSAGGGAGAGAGGSGGSVYLTTAVLTGSGTFAANGGNANTAGGGGTGGGGRVAVYSSSRTGFSGNTTSAVSAGTGTPATGTTGTVAFFDTSTGRPSVATYQRFTFPASSSASYTNITADNGSTLVVGGGATVNASSTWLITGNSTVQVQSLNTTAQVNGAWAGVGGTLNAATLQVDKGSTISADAQGYLKEEGPGTAIGCCSASGGSYGGAGGRINGNGTVDNDFEYGSESMPADLGSGGYEYGGSAGTGGGAIRLNVSGSLTLGGNITANGGAATNNAGGGSGGSVSVTAGSISGSGTFQANGGSATDTNAAGGGGGRIAVYSPAMSGYTGAATSTVAGGTAQNYPGTQGTLAFFDTSVANNNVSIYGGYNLPVNSTSTYDNLTVAQGGNLVMAGGAQLLVAQTLHLTGTITAQSVNTSGLVNGQYAGKGVSILANAAQIDASGIITADGLGYLAEQGPGAEPGPGSTAGGTYGGLGGRTDANEQTYGSATMPLDLGSGGWQYAGQGGAGGGAIELLVSTTLTLNGTLTANGHNPTQSAGGGAGGSVFVAANTINGTGSITANGGTLPTGGAGGGGGGRVSLLYVNAGSFAQSSISVAGGVSDQIGAAGTINFQQQAYSQFILPVQPAIHDTAQLEWFTDAGGTTAVSLAGPRTQQIATGAGAISTASFDTTAFPDGAYQLRLSVFNTAGQAIQVVTKPEVINNSVIWHSGTLTANAEWTAAKVHALDGNVIVPNGTTLTIDPGAIVKALPGTSIIVQSGGTLNALGTSTAPVIFTTFDDSSIGGNTDFNAGTSVPQPGEWQGIVVLGTGVYNSNGNTEVLYTQAVLSGTLPGNESLLGTRVYTITGTLTVPSGVTLNIQPGAVVKFGEGAGIVVQQGGVLNVSGTLAQPIYMTSLNDDSVGGNTSGNDGTILPVAGDWNTIEIDGGTATFNYAHILYGGGPQNSSAQAGMIETGRNATVTISNSELAYAFFIGVQTGDPNGGGDTVTITNTVFHNNEDRAINTFDSSTVHVVNDTFDSNAAGVFAHGGTVDVENSVVTNSSSTQFGNIGVCCGGSFSRLSYNDAYTTVSGVANYVGLTDPTGTNGNISAAPVYMNGTQHDFRPNYGSPLIDAADATVANYPATDSFNDARYSAPLVTTKTGKPDGNGKYPDIGAFEFVQSAPSNLDLTVSNVQGPKSAIVGQQVQVSWTVTNIGTGTVYGPWHDAVYLVADPNSNGVPVLAQTVLEGQGIVLGPGASYQATATITVPGTIVGMQQWQVRTNVLGEVFEGANTANNSANSLDTVAIDLQQILPGGNALTGSFAGDGQSAYFKILPSASQTTQVQLALTGVAGNAVELFIGAGYVPTPQHYDYAQTQFDATTVSTVIPAGAAQTYYVTAYAEDLASAPAGFTISANALSFSLTGVTPSSVVTAGDHTFTFTGGGFTSTTTFSLVDAAGDTLLPTAVYVADAAHADVTFHFNYAQGFGAITVQGAYNATATNGTQTLTLPNAVQVLSQTSGTSVPAGSLQINLDVPQAFRAGFPAIITVNYTNISGYDAAAPLMYVSATNATLAEVPPNCSTCSANYTSQYQYTFKSGLVLAISSQGPAGILPAGGSGSIQFLATPTGTSGTVSFAATEAIGDVVGTKWYDLSEPAVGCTPGQGGCTSPAPTPVALQFGGYATATAFCSSLVPSGQGAAGTTRACMQMLNNAGYTYTAPPAGIQQLSVSDTNACLSNPYCAPHSPENYIEGHLTAKQLSALLAADATAFSAQGDYVYDFQKLFAFELNKDGLSDFSQRMHLGSLGSGLVDQFDLKLTGTAGSLTEILADGSARTFDTPSSTSSNTWLGGATDRATATQLADGSWNIADPKVGQTLHFIAGQSGYILDSAQGPGTYSLQTTYTGNRMTGASDNLGNSLTLQYDAQGHILQSVDGMGNKRNFAYTLLNDTNNSAFLTSAVTAAGTYTYRWNTGGSHGVGYIDDSCIPNFCEPAVGILSEALPDSTHLNYTYNAAGRLVSQSKDDNAELTRFAYAANGSITTTDGSGVSTTVTPGANGIAVLTDSSGNQHHFKFDAESNFVGAIGALGGSSSVSYDANGNISGATRPGGSSTSLAYNANGLPATLTGPLAETYSFGYDSSGNMASFKDPSGQGFTFTYDANGNALTRTNRRGQTTTYTYSASNLLTSVTLSTGAQTTYTYDSQKNLLTVAGPAGTIRYTYDSQNRITAIANPDGTQLTYAYNANGQRSSITDSTGFTVNSTYDGAGRLSGLTGSNGAAIVSYTYDGAGKVSSQTMGNGTSTTYTYDGDGKVVSIVHKSASGASLGEYDYTHDANMQTLTETTPAGTNRLQYDLDDQVVGVTTPGGQWQYAYDSNGNRTSVSVNGVATNYAPNNLDEYTSVGSSAYLYDEDGNLTSGNGYTYTYDENNQLTSAAGSNDAWTYSYDALGKRTSVTHNGTTTRYLIDPSGFGNIVATFSGTGTVESHYIYGLGLTSVVPAGAAANYYDFDARGNTVVITGPNGAAVNSYSYLPFGEKTVSASGLTNLFTFNGMYGVTDDGPGLYGMRRRAYSPALGRFLQQDPTLFGGRDTNLYRYVGNNPMQLSDPCGSCWKAYDYFTHGLNALGGALPGVSGVIGGVVSVGTSVPGALGSDGSYSSDNIHDATSLGNGITGTTAGVVSLVSNAGGATGLAEIAGEVVDGAGIVGVVDEGSQVLFEQFGNAYYYQPGANGPLLYSPTDAQFWHMDDCPPAQPPIPPDTPPVTPPPAINIPHNPNDPVISFVAQAKDPNGKMTSGFGDNGYVPAGVPITYTIFFENQSTATAPAQKVTVTDALPKNLDFSTVQLTQVAFNNATLNIGPGTQTYQALATVSTDPNPVAVNASLNPTTGVLTWTMQSVDPVTSGTPANPLAGFLPPNNSANAGVGSVTFTVKPLANQANATTVTNQASIVFDANAAIVTNTVSNQLDTTMPISTVAALPATSGSTFTVSWSGSDPVGSGIASYNIYVSDNAGAYTLWQSGTTAASATYTGVAGHSYSFVSLATNNVGTVQTTPGAAATTTVASGTVVVAVTPTSSSITSAQALSVGISVTGSGTPTGTVVLTSGSYTSAAAALVSGATTIVIPANSLALGSDTLTATYTPDAAGASLYSAGTGNATVQVGTSTVQVAVGTSPATASFSVDGTAYTAAQTFTWTLGSSHVLTTTSPQTAAGLQQTFTAWSDGGAITHNVTATSGTTSYTATFATAYLLTTAASPAAGGAVTPASGSYYAAGTVVPVTATPASGYTFGGWSGPVASASTVQTTVTMSGPETVTANFAPASATTVTLSPGTLSFNSLPGLATVAQSVTLSNNSTAALAISGLTITGSGASSFAQTNTCGTSLAAGASCIVTVVFTPSAVASYSATLSLNSSYSGTAPAVALKGAGTTFTLAVAPNPLLAKSGTFANFTVTVAAQGGAENTPVTLTVAGLPRGAEAVFVPSSVTPGLGSGQSVLTIRIASPTVMLRGSPLERGGAPVLAFTGIALLALGRRRRKLVSMALIVVLGLFGAGCLTGCGHSTYTTYNLAITGTAGTQTVTTVVELNVQN